MTVTGDQLYEQMLANYKHYPPEELEKVEPYLRSEAYDPAVLLGHNTTACPPWCSRRHDTGCIGGDAPHIIHTQNPPQVIEHAVYDPANPNPNAPGFGVQLLAVEYADNPGKLLFMLDIVGDTDGIRAGSEEAWFGTMPIRYAEVIADALPQIHKMIEEA